MLSKGFSQNEIFKQKYITYKNKYLKLKAQLGGSSLEELQSKLVYKPTHCLNREHAFRQHAGECWSDAMQMMLCFSDELKDSIQQKLFNLTPEEIVEMAYLEGREKYLVPTYKTSSIDDVQNERVRNMKKKLIKYLKLLQDRICLHLGKSGLTSDIERCKHMNPDDETCPIIEKFGKYSVKKADGEENSDIQNFFVYVLPTLDMEIRDSIQRQFMSNPQIMTNPLEIKKIIGPYISSTPLQKKREEITGIGTAMLGLKMINRKIRGNSQISTSEHGATNEEQTVILNLLSFSLLNNDNVLTTKIINPNQLEQTDLDESIAIKIGLPKHATAFYTCQSNQMYYDDNHGIRPVNWKKLLTKYIAYQRDRTLILLWTEFGYLNLFKENGKDTCIVLDPEGEIYAEGVSMEEFIMRDPTTGVVISSWEKGIVENLTLIKKENLRGLSDDEIYNKLEDQIIISEIYNCSTSNIKLTKYNREIAFQIQYCRNNFLNEIVNKLNLSEISNLDKGDIIFAIVNNRYILDDSAFRNIKLIVDSGIDINSLYIKHSFGFLTGKTLLTPNDYNILKLFLDKGFDINYRNTLDSVVWNQNLELFNFLILNGATIDVKKILSTLFLFIKDRPIYVEFIKVIFNKLTDVNIKNDYDQTLLELSINHIELVKLLIEKGIDLNDKFSNNYTPLKSMLIDEKIEIVKLLIEKGIDVNQFIDDENTPLTLLVSNYSISEQTAELVKLLLNSGANVNLPNKKGISPLVILVSKYEINEHILNILNILLSAGADITATDDFGSNVLNIVEYKDNLKEIVNSYIPK